MSKIPSPSWLQLSIIAGFASFVSYGLAAFAPIPDFIGYTLAFAFGPLLMISSYGLYNFLQSHKDSIALRLAAMFNIVAAAMVTLMLVVQISLQQYHIKYKEMDRGEVTTEQLKWMFYEANSVQLGMDVAWDIFISVGTFLFAFVLWSKPGNKVLSATGMIISALLLSFNLVTFPEPPGDAGMIDFGPFTALWYLALYTYLLVRRKKIADKLSTD